MHKQTHTHTVSHIRIWLMPNQPSPHSHTQGCRNRGGGSGGGRTGLWFLSGRTTVGGSGCDLDTVWHTAFLMGHFDHCHSLYPQLGCCRMPQTQKLIQHSANIAAKVCSALLMMATTTVNVEVPRWKNSKPEFWNSCTKYQYCVETRRNLRPPLIIGLMMYLQLLSPPTT